MPDPRVVAVYAPSNNAVIAAVGQDDVTEIRVGEPEAGEGATLKTLDGKVGDELRMRVPVRHVIVEYQREALPTPSPSPEPEPLPEPEPEPEPEPPPTKKTPTMYIPMNKAEEFVDRLERAYSTWRGARDLRALAACPKYLKNGGEELVPMTVREVSDLADQMDEVDARGKRLAYRIPREKHSEFAGRSRVRKSVFNDVLAELQRMTARYSEIRAYIPNGPGYDSIKGFIDSRA